MKKKILYTLLAVFVLIQFIRPERNDSDTHPHPLSAKYTVPADVDALLKAACNDCHSNKTNYTPYINIQPIGWWMGNHIKDGKKHLNFSEFTHRTIAYQNHKFEEIVEQVESREMPLPSYSWFGIHDQLTDLQRKTLMEWAKTQMDTLKARYPADSLVLKRK
jgi:hypothetical protein